ARASLSSVELLTMGRAVYKLKDLFYKYKPDHFFGHNCRDELFRNWHCHFDNYGNYIPGYCSGLSLGNINDATDLFGDLNLAQLPLIKALSTDIKILYEMAKNDFNYNEDPTGYISICHLCLDIRRTIIQKGHDFLELRPAVFYSSIE
ncbi:MAG: hypothetical protein ABIL05_05595, partial [candidate division WOR-3 bacterium]